MIAIGGRWPIVVREIEGVFWLVTVSSVTADVFRFTTKAFLGREVAERNIPDVDHEWCPLGLDGWEWLGRCEDSQHGIVCRAGS